ncbi:hypothetical protein COLO4_10106 [Corchorus olitorius]|uniref:Uncharacterized protein n=1 Tax=Corchorus olitorius TaxID=93759 RepID=A0A1R3K9Z0_9ROSI|nr:hypothetical protein COLO4_10106 [Corchorus olitorius]
MELHENIRRTPGETVEFIKAYLSEFQRCQQATTTASTLVMLFCPFHQANHHLHFMLERRTLSE